MMLFAESNVSYAQNTSSRDTVVRGRGMPIPLALQDNLNRSTTPPSQEHHRGIYGLFAKYPVFQRYKLPEMEALFMVSFYQDRFSILACWSLALLFGFAMAAPSMVHSDTARLALGTCGTGCAIWAVVCVCSYVLRRELKATEEQLLCEVSEVLKHRWWLSLNSIARRAVEANAQRQEVLIVAALIGGIFYAAYLYPARGIHCDIQPSCASHVDLDASLLFFLPITLVISPLRSCVMAPLFAFMFVCFFAARFIPGNPDVDTRAFVAFATVSVTAATLTVMTASFSERWRREDFERMCLMQLDVHAMTVAREVATSSVGYAIPLTIAKRVIGGEVITELSQCSSMAILTFRQAYAVAATIGPGEAVQRLQRLALILDKQKRAFNHVVKFPGRGDLYVVAVGPFASSMSSHPSEPQPNDPDFSKWQSRLANHLLGFVQSSLVALREASTADCSLPKDDQEKPPTELSDVVCALDTGVLSCVYSANLSDCLVVGGPLEVCTSLLRRATSTSTRKPYRFGGLNRGAAPPHFSEEDTHMLIASQAFYQALPHERKCDFVGQLSTQNYSRRVEASSSQEKIRQDESACSFSPSVMPPAAPPRDLGGERDVLDAFGEDSLSPVAARREAKMPARGAAFVGHTPRDGDHSSSVACSPSSSDDTKASVFYGRLPFVGTQREFVVPSLTSSMNVLRAPSWGQRGPGSSLRLQLGGFSSPLQGEEESGVPNGPIARIEEEVRMQRECLGTFTFQRDEVEEGYVYYLRELATRGNTRWMFMCCGAMTISLVFVELMYRFSDGGSGKGLALLCVALVLDIVAGIVASFYSFGDIPVPLTLLFAGHCGLWYGAFVLEPEGTMLRNEQLIWGTILLTLGLLREHGHNVILVSIVDLIVTSPLLVLTFFNDRSTKIKMYVGAAQLIAYVICIVTRTLRDHMLRQQFASRVQGLLFTTQLEGEYETMEQLLLTLVPHRIAGRLLSSLRVSLRRPTFLPMSNPHKSDALDSTVVGEPDSSAGNEVRNTFTASLQPHIATMFTTSTVDTPFGFLSWSVPFGKVHPYNGPHGAPSTTPMSLDMVRQITEGLLRGWQVVQQAVREQQEGICVMPTGDSCVIVDESCAAMDRKLERVFSTVRAIATSVAATNENDDEPRLALSAVLHTGPLMGAVIGKLALSYEYFGEALSTARRMCKDCLEPNAIVGTERFCELLRLSWLHRERQPLLPHAGTDICFLAASDPCGIGARFSSPALPWTIYGRPSPVMARFITFTFRKAANKNIPSHVASDGPIKPFVSSGEAAMFAMPEIASASACNSHRP